MSGAEALRRIAMRAMQERGLLPAFSPAALRQAQSLRAPVAPSAAPSATQSAGADGSPRDLRSLPWSSIDNDDSRDLDQLEVAETLAGGATRVLVAVADVDALVERDSPIDEHARCNTTSVYTAAQTFPMLPERLSTDLTSLGEGADRLAIVVELDIAASGEVTASQVYRAWVRNRAKLAYDGVGAWLEGRAPAPARVGAVPGLDRQLRLQDEAAQRLRKLRRARGALSLETREARAVIQGGLLTDLRPEESNRAKELIEDFMIAANGAIARFLADRKFPSLRRVLREPQRWSRIVALARAAADALPDAPDSVALEAFLARRQRAAPERFADLSLAVVKLLGRGEYAAEQPGEPSPGHFALAVLDYAHSTAPNRRFPDLVTHRLVKAALAGRPAPYRMEELAALAAHCTQQESNAAKVERRVRKSAAALLLEHRVGERFEAVVTGVTEEGVWVRIARPAAEGKLIQGAQGLDVGDRLDVRLVSTDVERGYVDFARSEQGVP
jgi:exoribonuclease II